MVAGISFEEGLQNMQLTTKIMITVQLQHNSTSKLYSNALLVFSSFRDLVYNGCIFVLKIVT